MPQKLNLPLVTRVCGKARYYDQGEAEAHRAALEHWELTIGPAGDGSS